MAEAAHFLKILQGVPKFQGLADETQQALAAPAIRHLGERVLHSISLIEDLSLRSVESRLAHTLLQYARLCDGQLIVPRREWAPFEGSILETATHPCSTAKTRSE